MRVLFQTSRVECGLACLAMILGHHGHQVSIRELRDRCPVGRSGAGAGTLVREARKRGMTAAGYRASPEVFERIGLPAIAHWEADHYVVVERVGRTQVRVIDPQTGRRRLTLEEFREGLGRVAIGLSPGEEFTRRRSAEKPYWRTYFRELLSQWGTRGLVAQVLVVSLLIQLLGLAMPLIVRMVVDGLDTLRAPGALALIGAGIAVIAAGQLVTGYLRAVLVLYLQGRLDTEAMLRFCGHLLRLPVRYFQQRSTGDIVSRMGGMVLLREQLTGQTLGSVLDVATVLTYLVLLFAIDPATGLGVLAVVGLLLLLLVRATRVMREGMAADIAAHAEEQSYLIEMLHGITTVKASAAEERAFEKWSRLFVTWMKVSLRRGHTGAAIDSAAGSLRVLTPLVVLWLGTVRVLAGDLSVGTMLAMTWMAASVVAPLAVLVANGQRLQLAGAYLQRLADVFESQPEAEPLSPALVGKIEISGVSFRYDPEGASALQEVSLRVEPGQRMAVVGATGAGKTTLALLVLGLHQPQDGTIRVDGFEPELVRGGIGTVLQEPFVFSGTVHENIAFHDPATSRDDVVAAATAAALHEEIMALPGGYNTRLPGLSGGQQQRLALARALIRRPAVLLLDEATSHLDAVTEARVNANLRDLRCTQIVIAHRLSTVRDADQIAVLDGGRLVELGTHGALLAKGGAYAGLIAAQLDSQEGGDRNGEAAHEPARGRA